MKNKIQFIKAINDIFMQELGTPRIVKPKIKVKLISKRDNKVHEFLLSERQIKELRKSKNYIILSKGGE